MCDAAMDWLASWLALTNGGGALDKQLDDSMKSSEILIAAKVGTITDFLNIYGDRLDVGEIIHLDAVISETLGIFLGRAIQIGLEAPIIPALRDRDWGNVEKVFTPVSNFVVCRDHIRAASMRIINNLKRGSLEEVNEEKRGLLVIIKTTITRKTRALLALSSR
jgi:hypothetical protein